MEVIYLLLLLGAAICFFVVAFVHPKAPVNGPRPAMRVDLVGLGLLLWVLVSLVQLLVGFEV